MPGRPRVARGDHRTFRRWIANSATGDGLGIEQGDAPGLARTAHSLKGSIGNFSEGPAYRAVEKLEEQARRNDLASVRAGFPSVEIAIQQLKEALAPFRNAGLTRSMPGPLDVHSEKT
ncbi:MAG: Hpt domain-containing protein [Candidatus Acidiferrales bacterium]